MAYTREEAEIVLRDCKAEYDKCLLKNPGGLGMIKCILAKWKCDIGVLENLIETLEAESATGSPRPEQKG